jgi:molybdopterin synthase catalytic subunit
LIEIRKRDFDVNEILSDLVVENVGALVTFIGTVRGTTENRGGNVKGGSVEVRHLEYDIYREMALSKMEAIREKALSDYDIHDIHIIHRIGTLKPTEKIVLIAVSASHRKDAFSACEFAIDELKKIVPIWKKEVTADSGYWIGKEESEGIV